MNLGKVSNSILKRSVLKLIRHGKKEVISGPGIGMDCAVIEGKVDCNIALAISDSIFGVYRVFNNLSSVGADTILVMNNIIMPHNSEEKQLKSIVNSIQGQCNELGLEIVGGHTEVSNAVITPVISITGIGYTRKDVSISSKNIQPNQDIIMSKWIGIEGIRIIAESKRDEILQVYTEDFFDQAIGNKDDMSVSKEAKLAIRNGVKAIHDVSEGGIFGALWDMSEAGKVGLEIDFKKINVKQEIIEICELFDKNPYEMASSGCLLMTYENGCDIVKLLNENGIRASVIGKTTSGNDRIIRNGDEIRFIEPPKRDEIYTI